MTSCGCCIVGFGINFYESNVRSTKYDEKEDGEEEDEEKEKFVK